MKRRLFKTMVAVLAIAAAATGPARAQSISAFDGQSQTISSDQTCTGFTVFDGSTLTVNQGVTLTLNISNGNSFNLFDNSTLQLHGTLAGSVASGATWLGNTYINVYLSDGAKFTVSGLECQDGDDYLRYHGYDAGTNGHGTVSVTDGPTEVTANTLGYKTTTYTFTATPASGYRFVNWTKGAGGEELGTAASIAVSCEQNGQYQVYANFEEDVPAVPHTVRFADGNNGWQVQDVTAATSAVAPAVLENVIAGDSLVVTAPTMLPGKVKSVKAVKYVPPTTPLDNTTTTWADGRYAVPEGGLTYSDAITVSGDVTLTLTDGTTLTLNKGISLASGATLTVEGNGTMVVNGTNNSTASTVAGTGTLVLTSGTLTARGGNGGNIGNDTWDAQGGNGGVAINGSVTVSGGTLTARGGNGGNIGNDSWNAHGGNGGDAISGTLTINGGSTSVNNGSNGSIGEDSLGSTAGAGGKAVAGTVTDNR